MPKTLPLLFFLMQLAGPLPWAQNGSPEIPLLQKDAQRIEDRRAAYEKFLPQDLRKEMLILDSIIHLEYIARNEQLQLLATQVSKVKQDRETALQRLYDMEGQLARKSTELGQLESALNEARADQKLHALVINSLGVFVFVLLSYLFYKYKKRRYEWFAKMRLQKVNADLAIANEQLKEKKERLEALLRELHHRSKNNLQQISGLLYLHARQLRDDDARAALREARNRIDALGIVHRQLYQMPQQGLTSVNIADYAGELVDHLLNTHKLPREKIKTRYRLQQNLLIELDTATHIGLLLNELVTNSFKHAFPQVTAPMLDISIQAEDQVLYLTVRDNGPGLPADWSLKEVSSFGLKLVNLLVEQSEGSLRYDSREGACFLIDLPLKKNEYEIPAVL